MARLTQAGSAHRSARRTRHGRVRLYETVRTAHLERAHQLVPASIVYGSRRYDFDSDVAAGLDLVQASLAQTAAVLWRSRVTTLEVNEPLMNAGLRRGAVAIAVLRARHPRRPPETVTYAIENRDPAKGAAAAAAHSRGGTAVAGTLRAWAREALDRALRWYVWRHLDRIAYGTEAARDLYSRALPVARSGTAARVVPALPTRCSCGPLDAKDPNLVLFLGAFADRKGFRLLLEAWPLVLQEVPDARLSLVGKGSLEDLARAATADLPGLSLEVDPPRSEVHAHLRSAAVLVLPSQPAPNWREQVGLPIVEGLAHGCSVVTTSETGLASWLGEHAHEVVRPGGPATDLANAVVRSLAVRRTAASVLADLPSVDGRLAADRWLFDDDDTGST